MKNEIIEKIFPFLNKDRKNNILNAKEVQLSYKKKLASLAKKIKTDKIRVVFLVRENQKWAYQSLYEIFEKDERFEPIILISLLILSHKGKDKTRNNLEENYEFFKSRNMRVEYAYKDGKYLEIKDFHPDILFYDQQYDLIEGYTPQKVSEYALPCYSSYSYELMDTEDDYTANFHAYLYKFLVEHELNIKRYESFQKYDLSNCFVGGYPKIDVYLDKKPAKDDFWKDKSKKRVIYAPHHSVDKRGLHLSMFVETSKFILELAKKHPETTWIFKPHPRLKYALQRSKTMDKKAVEKYYDEWRQIGTIYEQGDYFDIFKTSDLMITDGCSFLAEYLPSQKPLIRIINNNAMKLNELGNKITEEYYFAHNNEEIEALFNEVLIKGNDYKKEARLKLINEIIDYNESSAEKIYKHILEDITTAEEE